MFYFVKTPWWLKKYYSKLVWDIPDREKTLYLSFDDGPHPVATPFVLDELKKYGARATFFCLGKNVADHPQIYKRTLMEGHRVGNHTHDHVNGWKSGDKEYLSNIRQAAGCIDSTLFRPPYGRITAFQSALLRAAPFEYKIIMWTVLSADFDRTVSPEKCLRNVTRNAGPGSIVVFHDSEKAFERLQRALPEVLQYFSERGYRFEPIPG